MAINGVNSYMGYYNYQASINNFRLSQALANNQRFTQAMSSVSGSSSNSYRNTSLTSSMAFVKNYSSSMSDLMGSANALRSANQSGVMNDYVVSSSDASVAKATEKLTVRNAQQMDFDVQQLAAAQVNVSEGVKASDKASSDMDFTVGNALNSVNVKVSAVNSDGSAKTNADMLKEAGICQAAMMCRPWSV